MDQTFVSGLGNIYVNETLFISKIKPMRLCNSLNKNEINYLILNIKKIFKFSISKGGSSIRDFQNALGKSDNFQQFFHVYGRKNKNCSRISCTGKIKKTGTDPGCDSKNGDEAGCTAMGAECTWRVQGL